MRLFLPICLIFVFFFCSALGFSRLSRSVGGGQAKKPKYLDIEGWKKCMDSKQVGEAHNVWCMPENKPEACEQTSWEQLNGLGEDEQPSTCASIS